MIRISLKQVLILLFCTYTLHVAPTESANILALFPSPSPSHLIVDAAVVNSLAERHHNVTVITVLPLKSNMLHTNITHIQLKSGLADMEAVIRESRNSTGKLLAFLDMVKTIKSLATTMVEILDDEEFKHFLQNKGNNFELVVIGYFFNDYVFGLAAHFNCPIALVWPNQPLPFVLNFIGNPYETSYVPIALIGMSSEINFKFRLLNFVSTTVAEVVFATLRSWMKSIYDLHFPADKYPSFQEAREKVSLVLYCHHFSEKPVRALVPGLIEIGGIQLSLKPRKLPRDIEDFLDSGTTQGVIFFSLGTNARKAHMEPDTLHKIFNILSKLPQKIIWKCDETEIPGNSTNILFKSWLPQADILAHPNVRIFFTHGGKGGITEAIFNGVPMEGLPLFGEQLTNLNEVVKNGYGVVIPNFKIMTEDDISQAVKEVLENPKYKTQVQQFSKVYKDRPMSAKETAVYWLEYVIRHKGAVHMKSPLKSLSLIEAYNFFKETYQKKRED